MSAAPDRPPPEPWGSFVLEDGEERRAVLGPLTLHLERLGDEIRLAHSREGAAPDARPSRRGLEWSRWATRDGAAPLTLTPTFADRPLVVAPEEPFHLLAGASARIYVRVPLWVKVESGPPAGPEGTTTLATLPCIPFSDTWWGDTEEGELAHWLTTHARRSLSEALFEPHLAICPLQLMNRSEEDLHVDKVALRVGYLSLYVDEGRIWSDETRVHYQDHDEGSRLEMDGRPPQEAEGARLLAPARHGMGRGFRARTFARLRSIPGWMA